MADNNAAAVMAAASEAAQDAADRAEDAADRAAAAVAEARAAASEVVEAAGQFGSRFLEAVDAVNKFTARVESSQMKVAEVQEAMVAVGNVVEKQIERAGLDCIDRIRSEADIARVLTLFQKSAAESAGRAAAAIAKSIKGGEFTINHSDRLVVAMATAAQRGSAAPAEAPSAEDIAAAVVARMPSRRGMSPVAVGAFFAGGVASVLIAPALRVDALPLPLVGAGTIAAGVLATAIAWWWCGRSAGG